MPDLGKYAAEVGMAYGISLGLLAVLIGFVMLRSARVKRAVREVESRVKGES